MSTEEIKIDIPEDLQQICKELAKVAQQNGLLELSGKFNSGYSKRHRWLGEISFDWKQGRHGEDSNDITIWSNFHVSTKVKS